jgi:tRNA(His) 5'-end guanylyltransferase
MKEFYENRTRTYLPRRTYTLIRIDGKAFHTFTKGLPAPFSEKLIDAMNFTAEVLCKEIQGVKFGYVQSDEISLVLTDFDTLETSAWFDGNIQKIASVAASIATKAFNAFWLADEEDSSSAEMFYRMSAAFDARVWTINQKNEVINYFLWRQEDAIKNSIASVAQSEFSTKELHKKNQKDQLDMLEKIGINWYCDFDEGKQRGRIIEKFEILKNGAKKFEFLKNGATRTKWVAHAVLSIREYPNFLKNLLPDL